MRALLPDPRRKEISRRSRHILLVEGRIGLGGMQFDPSLKLGPRSLNAWQAGEGVDRWEPEPLVTPEKNTAKIIINTIPDNHAEHALIFAGRVL